MDNTNLIGIAVAALGNLALYVLSWRLGHTRERNLILRHAYNFAEAERVNSGRISPTLMRFVRSLERGEHRK